MVEDGRKMAEKALKDGVANGEMIANQTLAEMVEVYFYIVLNILYRGGVVYIRFKPALN